MRNVKRLFAAAVFTGSLVGGVLVGPGTAHAAPPPGSGNNCRGVVVSSLAQDANGLGNAARLYYDGSVKAIQTFVRTTCS